MEYVAGQSLAHLIGHSGLQDSGRAEVRGANSGRAGGRARRWNSPSRPQAGQHHGRATRDLVKVLDFGLAKLTESVDFQPADERVTTGTAPAEGQPQTEEGTILGTAAYMSPEQAEGKPADARSDVFSFGAVLYEMITGRRAFSGATKMSTLAAILTTEPEPPSHVVPGLSRDLEKMIVRCLRKSPERRWQSMADLKVALEDLLEEVRFAQPG